jgi:hypothetical protein
MELDLLLFSDRVEAAEGQKLDILGALWDTIRASSAPIVHSEMSVVIRVLARRKETVDPHELELAILDASGNEITQRSGDIVPLPEAALADEPAKHLWRYIWVVQLRDLEFPDFGAYEFSVRVDGIELGRSQLYVKTPE